MEPLRHRCGAYHRRITAPGVLCRIFHHFCSHWIQHHIAAEFQQIALSLNQNSLESSLENMTDAAVAAIEALRINTIELTHARRKVSLRRFNKQMVVIV